MMSEVFHYSHLCEEFGLSHVSIAVLCSVSKVKILINKNKINFHPHTLKPCEAQKTPSNSQLIHDDCRGLPQYVTSTCKNFP